MNTVNIVGRITDDPVKRVTTSGISVCQFTLAVDRPRVKDTTDFISCVAWRQSADFLCNYGHKGDRVGVSGVLTQRSFEDKNGNKRTNIEVNCEDVSFGESKKSREQSETGGFRAPDIGNAPQNFEELPDDDGDVPF